MDHVEIYNTDENKPNTIRKKLFLRDGSYRIFYITKKSKEESDDDDHHHGNNIDPMIDKKTKEFSKIKNRNGLKQFLFLHKTTCNLSSDDQTNELSQSVTCSDTTAMKASKTNQLKNETIVHNHLLARPDRFEPTSRKQIFISMHPEILASVHRRRKRFTVACGTVLVALTIIITIIIYAIVMTINHRIQMSQSSFRNYPR